MPARPAASRGDDYQQKEREFRQRRIQAEAAEEKQKQDTAQHREKCNRERDELAQMRDAGRLYTLNENGERSFMDDAARNAAIARQERLVAQLCSG